MQDIFDWLCTSKLVGEGEIETGDTMHLVDGIPIGGGAYLVYVERVFEPNAFLWRNQNNWTTLDNALGEIIPWPKETVAMFIILSHMKTILVLILGFIFFGKDDLKSTVCRAVCTSCMVRYEKQPFFDLSLLSPIPPPQAPGPSLLEIPRSMLLAISLLCLFKMEKDKKREEHTCSRNRWSVVAYVLSELMCLDDLLQKGYGLGSGISLFIATNISSIADCLLHHLQQHLAQIVVPSNPSSLPTTATLALNQRKGLGTGAIVAIVLDNVTTRYFKQGVVMSLAMAEPWPRVETELGSREW
ncbi:hypothetical protein Sjap_025995 [Stephania japonica]|uniref:Uncharacterized protein n=1 Tax=Stephania japonica TaxID=461633 RepID=A0AAP0EAK7_9MAGN